MKNILLGLIVVVGLAACSKETVIRENTPANGSGTPAPGTPESRESNNGPAPAGCGGPLATSIENGRGWKNDFESQGIKFTITTQVTRNSIRVTNDCSMRGYSLRATAVAAASYTQNTLTVHNRAQESKTLNENGVNLNCNVDISPGQVNYSLRGSCLVLNDGSGSEMVLFPAN